MPTTAGPQRRMASVASATATGTAKILKIQSMGLISGAARAPPA